MEGRFQGDQAPPIGDPMETFMVISSDTLGRDPDIGAVLVKGFFETMKNSALMPRRIFFLNAGVKLTTVRGDIIPVLIEMERSGVEIYSCGTCLKHYCLEDKLKVGYRGTTGILVESLQEFQKTIWI